MQIYCDTGVLIALKIVMSDQCPTTQDVYEIKHVKSEFCTCHCCLVSKNVDIVTNKICVIDMSHLHCIMW